MKCYFSICAISIDIMKKSQYFECPRKPTCIVSIDVGIIHLGLVQGKINKDGFLVALPVVELVDLTNLAHTVVKRKHCKLYHSKELSDRLDHFYQEYAHIFNDADLILIERQPIHGLQAVQQSLFKQFRDRVILISPNKMHAHFKLCKCYEGRKVQTTAILKEVFRKIPHDSRRLHAMDRLHDIGDAVCILIYYTHGIRKGLSDLVEAKTTRQAVLNSNKNRFARFMFRAHSSCTIPTDLQEDEGTPIQSDQK